MCKNQGHEAGPLRYGRMPALCPAFLRACRGRAGGYRPGLGLTYADGYQACLRVSAADTKQSRAGGAPHSSCGKPLGWTQGNDVCSRLGHQGAQPFVCVCVCVCPCACGGEARGGGRRRRVTTKSVLSRRKEPAASLFPSLLHPNPTLS